MIKKILILLFLLLITAYLIVAVTAFNTKPADQVCKGMELIIKDSIDPVSYTHLTLPTICSV